MSPSLNTKIAKFLFDKTRYYVSYEDNRDRENIEALSFYKNQLVIPRAKSVYKTFSVAGVQKADLNAFVANQVIALSPFESNGFYVRYQQNVAMLWIWDSEYELSLLEKFDLHLGDTDILPETVLYPPGSGPTLVTCKLGGYEGQIWNNGVLAGSRYWHNKPDHNQIAHFLRSIKAAPTTELRQITPEHFLGLPWYEKKWSFLLRNEFAEKAVPAIAFAVLFLLLGWQVANYALLSVLLNMKEEQLATKQVEVETTLTDRNKALTYNQQNAALNGKVTYSQMALLYDVASKLTDDVSDILEWHFRRDEIRIEVNVSGNTGLDVATIVSRMEELPFVRSVSISRLGNIGNRWEIKAEVQL